MGLESAKIPFFTTLNTAARAVGTSARPAALASFQLVKEL